MHHVTHGLFNNKYQRHDVLTLSISEIRHLNNMPIPNHPTKTWQIWVIHQDDATVIPAPNQLTLFGCEVCFTEYAICHGKNVYENGI
jgi:hypothetical protein